MPIINEYHLAAKIEGTVKFPQELTDCSEDRSLTEEFLNATFGETHRIQITGRAIVADHFSYRVKFEDQEDFEELLDNLKNAPAITVLSADLED